MRNRGRDPVRYAANAIQNKSDAYYLATLKQKMTYDK